MRNGLAKRDRAGRNRISRRRRKDTRQREETPKCERNGSSPTETTRLSAERGVCRRFGEKKGEETKRAKRKNGESHPILRGGPGEVIRARLLKE